jgi:hypothetical protein
MGGRQQISQHPGEGSGGEALATLKGVQSVGQH